MRTGSAVSWAASAASVPESTPPESSTPTGTSATRCARTESRSRARHSSTSSASSSPRTGSGPGRAKRSSAIAPSAQVRRWPGGSFRISRKIESGAGTTFVARNASSGVEVELALRERVELGGELELAVDGPVGERLDAEAVACEHEALPCRASQIASANIPRSRSANPSPHSS